MPNKPNCYDDEASGGVAREGPRKGRCPERRCSSARRPTTIRPSATPRHCEPRVSPSSQPPAAVVGQSPIIRLSAVGRSSLPLDGFFSKFIFSAQDSTAFARDKSMKTQGRLFVAFALLGIPWGMGVGAPPRRLRLRKFLWSCHPCIEFCISSTAFMDNLVSGHV
jgi:hypothetical protein